MRQKLLALAATLLAAGAGTVVFMNWESGTVDRVIERSGNWEWVDRDSCSVRACNTAPCNRAADHLNDAGSLCSPRLVACDFRISQRVRNCFADAGVALSSKKYQRLELMALRCPGVDGGFTFGTAFNDAGCPVEVPAVITPLCVRAPHDGGTGCTRRLADGGTRFFGTGNVIPVDAGVGAQCEPCPCSVMFGDNPTVDL